MTLGDSFLFNLLEEFEKDPQKIFFACLVEFPSEDIRSWAFVCRDFSFLLQIHIFITYEIEYIVLTQCDFYFHGFLILLLMYHFNMFLICVLNNYQRKTVIYNTSLFNLKRILNDIYILVFRIHQSPAKKNTSECV